MKKILLIVVLVFSIAGAYAQHLTEQQAMQRTLQYLSDKSTSASRRIAPSAGNGGITLESAPVEARSIYAFNLENGGFVIASADNRALPILGYSTSGSIDWENMPDNMRSWLIQYDEALESLGNNDGFVDGDALGSSLQNNSKKNDRRPVEPIIKSHWDQFGPYWNKCPIYKGDTCLTGCTCTAVAQILNHYQWPKSMPNGLPDYDIEDVNPVWHIEALPPVVFDWDNILDEYNVINLEAGKREILGNRVQQEAVATLMRYCGQALNTTYGTYSLGGTYTSYGKPYHAFVDYFDYPAIYLRRSLFNIEEWDSIIYNEVSAGRPVLYEGLSDNGGHSFICDGYDGNGLFHINWGWSGQDDGYFSLSVLNPYNNTSAGSGSSGIGFSIYQDAIIHLDPQMERQAYPFRHTFQQYSIEIYNDSVKYYYDFAYEHHASGDNALGTIGQNGQPTPLFMADPNDSIIVAALDGLHRNVFIVKVDSTVFEPGDTVALYPMFKLRQQDAEWQIIPPIGSHLLAGKTDKGLFFIKVSALKEDLELMGGEISKGTGRLKERSDLTITVRNNSTVCDFTDELFLVPRYYGHIDPSEITASTHFISDNEMECGAYIKAGDENQVTFSFVPIMGGYTKFELYTYKGKYIGSFSLELNNDTLANYDKYVNNNSYFALEGNRWSYKVELTDKPGVDILNWIPSDSIRLMIRFYRNEEKVIEVALKDEIREYLKDLPDKGGKGDYKFEYCIPVELDEDGVYFMDSYLRVPRVNDKSVISCIHEHMFIYSNPASVKTTTADQADGPFYNLEGYPLDGIPERKGIYIKDGKIIYIK